MNHSGYISYMLRMWKVRQGDEDAWQASLDDPRTGERYGFANLETLTSFLREKIHGKDIKQTVASNNESKTWSKESEE